MATHDYSLSNQSGSSFRTDLNNALAAIVSGNSSGTEPSTTFAYMEWNDTSSGTKKIRNAANNAWIELFQLDGTLTMEDGAEATPGLAFRDDLNTGIWSSGADTLDVSTGGTERLSISSAGVFKITGTVGVGTATPYAYDTTATTLEVKASVASAAAIEVARFRGGQDANGGAAVLRLTNDNDRGLVLKGGRESDSEFAEIGTSSFNGTYTRGLRLDGAGRVLIGTTDTGDAAADDLVIGDGQGNRGLSIRAAADGWCSIYLADGTSGSANYMGIVAYDHTTDALKLYSNGWSSTPDVTINSTGTLEIGDGDLKIATAGHGVDFSATSDAGGMTSELLDWYEEGTWTPTDQSGAGGTFSVTGAVYTRIGRMVYARAHSIVFPTSSDSNTAYVGGLPFTCGNSHGSGGRHLTSDADASVLLVDNNSSKFWIYAAVSTSGSTNAQISGATIYGLLLVYEAA